MKYTLRLKNSIDIRKAIKILDDLIAKPLSYIINDTDLIFNDEEDLQTAKSILSNKGIFNMIQKKSGKVFLTFTELQDLKQILMDKLYTVPNRTEIKDIYTYPELIDWLWRNAKKQNINNFNNKNMEKKSEQSELEKGKQTEKEHKDVYKHIDKDVKEDGILDTTFDEFTEGIAKDHIKELPDYYDRLQTMEEDAKLDMKKESMNYWMKRQTEVNNEYNRIVKSSLNVSGAIEEIIIDEPLANAMDDITDEHIVEEGLTVEQPSADLINPEQSISQITQQLKVYFLDNYKNDYTYENIVKSAQETGLFDTLDLADLMNLLNKLAIEVGLPRTDWSQYITDDSEEEMISDISKGKENSVSYNEDNVNIENIMESYDNAPENLFVIDRILEERLKMNGIELEPIVEESKELVKNSLKRVKKNCSVINYKLNDVSVDKVNNSGTVVAGKVIFDVKLQFLKKGRKIHKSIEITLPIKNGELIPIKEFKYINTSYPLQTYYLNDLIER